MQNINFSPRRVPWRSFRLHHRIALNKRVHDPVKRVLRIHHSSRHDYPKLRRGSRICAALLYEVRFWLRELKRDMLFELELPLW